MKILRTIHSLNPAGGGPLESIRQSTLVLQRHDHEVEIATLDAPNEFDTHDFPAAVHPLGPGRGSYGYSARFVPWLKNHRPDYDAVIAHGIWQYSSFGVWRALRGSATPYFVFPHGMLDPWFKRTYPLKHLKKLLYWPWAEYRVLRDAAAVLFTSEEERRLARKSFLLYRANEVVVNYGTAAPQVDQVAAKQMFLAQFPAVRAKKFFLFLGRLHEKKGCDLLIRAFASLGPNEYSMVIAGPCQDRDYRGELQRLTNESGYGDRIVFPGMLDGDLKWGAFAAADAFVLPSHQENFGIAIAEALACGTPALISDQINIWREVEGDGAGYVAPDTLEGTRGLLERWIATPLEAREAMREKARACFARRFEINRATDSLLEVLRQYLPKPAANASHV